MGLMLSLTPHIEREMHYDAYDVVLLAEMGQLSRVGEKSAPRSEHVLRARAAPFQQVRAAKRYAMLSLLGFLHYDRV